MKISIDSLYENKYIEPIDHVFARTIDRLSGDGDPWVTLAAALVSRAASDGHVCLDLATVTLSGIQGTSRATPVDVDLSLDSWRSRLAASAAVGEPGAFRPLILDGDRLYLHRYWMYEQLLTKAILERCSRSVDNERDDLLATGLEMLFPKGDGDGGQRQAAELAATRLFSVISGGPGTGKTHTISSIILLMQVLAGDSPLNIALAAPTGKAAARLQESLESIDFAAVTADNRTPVTIQKVQTIHRLLGYQPSRASFRYHADRRLPADAVIVDEASMIDLALMTHLIGALRPEAPLVLVGDKDQLASVEAGAVLGDICYGVSQSGQDLTKGTTDDASTPSGLKVSHGMDNSIAVLRRSFRFDAGSGLGALSRAVCAGDAVEVMALLEEGGPSGIELRPFTGWGELAGLVAQETLAHYAPMFAQSDLSGAFKQLGRFKVLAVMRKGPYGVEALNNHIEQVLRDHDAIAPVVSSQSPWYPGRPVMINRNDYHHNLFNGDVGIATEPGGSGDHPLRVAFPGPDGAYKQLSPHQLPSHETVYAMTVHKSQGSEFDRVMVVLPDQDMPLLTRELIYTAVTRARKSVIIWSRPALLEQAVRRRIRRASGLRQALWPRA